jgi:hypothetical protein
MRIAIPELLITQTLTKRGLPSRIHFGQWSLTRYHSLRPFVLYATVACSSNAQQSRPDSVTALYGYLARSRLTRSLLPALVENSHGGLFSHANHKHNTTHIPHVQSHRDLQIYRHDFPSESRIWPTKIHHRHATIHIDTKSNIKSRSARRYQRSRRNRALEKWKVRFAAYSRYDKESVVSVSQVDFGLPADRM